MTICISDALAIVKQRISIFYEISKMNNSHEFLIWLTPEQHVGSLRIMIIPMTYALVGVRQRIFSFQDFLNSQFSVICHLAGTRASPTEL